MRKDAISAQLGQLAARRARGLVKVANPRLKLITDLAKRGLGGGAPAKLPPLRTPPMPVPVPRPPVPRPPVPAPGGAAGGPAMPPLKMPGAPPGGAGGPGLPPGKVTPPPGGPGAPPPAKAPVPPGGPGAPPAKPPVPPGGAGGPGGPPPKGPPPGGPGAPPPGGPGAPPPGGPTPIPTRASLKTPPAGSPPGAPPGGPVPVPTRASVTGGDPMSLRAKLGLGAAGATGVAGAGAGGLYAASDKDHIGGMESDLGELEAMKRRYEQELADYKATGGSGIFGGSSGAEREAKIKEMEANLASGNFGGGTFGGSTYAQRKAQAQARADLLAENKQRSGGVPNRLFGYRDQGAVDSAMGRFDDEEMKKRFAALGITGPRGRTAKPAATAAKPTNPLIGTAATNWDDYRNTYHNPYAGRDWSHLLQTSPSYMAY